MPFIIDGYNLLWSIQKDDQDSAPITDVALCQIISRYLTSINQDGEIVFDGIGPPEKTGFDNLQKLEVIFSGQNNDADSVIETKIKANFAPKRLTIVSSDQRLRNAARARKATSVKSETFWPNVCKQLDRKQQIKEPPEKRQGLTTSETNQWLKFFDLDQ